MVALGGLAFSYERGTPVAARSSEASASARVVALASAADDVTTPHTATCVQRCAFMLWGLGFRV